MGKAFTSGETGAATGEAALQLERSYWESYQDYDWSSDETKAQAISRIPRLDGDILEICVGGGAFARRIPRTYRSYTGLDLSQSLLNALKSHMPHINAVHGDAQDLPFEDATYDAVLVFSGLHHLPRFEKTLADSYRSCGPAVASSALSRTTEPGIERRCATSAASNGCVISSRSTPRTSATWIPTR